MKSLKQYRSLGTTKHWHGVLRYHELDYKVTRPMRFQPVAAAAANPYQSPIHTAWKVYILRLLNIKTMKNVAISWGYKIAYMEWNTSALLLMVVTTLSTFLACLNNKSESAKVPALP